MNNNKKLEVLRVYNKNPAIQEVIYTSMIEECAPEGLFTEQVLFILMLYLSKQTTQEKNLSKSVEEIKKTGVTQKGENV